MGGGDGGASWKLKKAAKKIFALQTCGGSFCHRQQTHVSPVSRDSRNYYSSSLENQKRSISCKNNISSEIAEQGNSSTNLSSNKNLCSICLDPLNYSSGSSGGKAIFTAQCSHAFHFACITSNVRHGSVTCPICRARWTQLPRYLNTRCPLHNNKDDAVLEILDDSIANSRVHTRSFFRPARYNDDDDNRARLSFSLLTYPSSGAYYLRVKLAHQPASNVVLVASPNGPHLRLMKQAMALVVSSLRPIDRLAIVTCSSLDARVCALRRMTSYGKRTALKIIDQIFYTVQADDTMEGLKKGVKILEDRVHENPRSCVLHLTDAPTSRSHHQFDSGVVPVTIHRFDVGFGFGARNYGSIVQEFEEFLAGTLGGRVEDIQLRIGERKNMVVRIGELRGGEERNIPLCLGESGRVCMKYSYRDGRDGECVRTGDVVVGIEEEDKGDRIESRNYAGNWDYHDSFMARRL